MESVTELHSSAVPPLVGGIFTRMGKYYSAIIVALAVMRVRQKCGRGMLTPQQATARDIPPRISTSRVRSVRDIHLRKGYSSGLWISVCDVHLDCSCGMSGPSEMSFFSWKIPTSRAPGISRHPLVASDPNPYHIPNPDPNPPTPNP